MRSCVRIFVDPPDVVCLQEGLEGMDILSQAGRSRISPSPRRWILHGQVGYKRIASSVLRAQALRDAVQHTGFEGFLDGVRFCSTFCIKERPEIREVWIWSERFSKF